MSKVMRMLGYVWAAPVTVLALLYVLAFSALGWYKFVGSFDDALVWSVQQEKLPDLLNRWWARWGGHCFGNVVVVKIDLNTDRGKMTLRHEQEHVRQCMVLGIFQPIIYALIYVTIKLSCRHSDPYYSNIFEIDARRAAGQLVDVEGAVKKIQTMQSQTKKNA